MKIRKSTAHYITNRGTIPSNPSAMKTSILSLAAVIASLNGTTAWVPKKSSSTNVVGHSLLSSIPRGGANEYETKFESVKCSVIEKANRKVRSVGSCLLVFVRTYDVVVQFVILLWWWRHKFSWFAIANINGDVKCYHLSSITDFYSHIYCVIFYTSPSRIIPLLKTPTPHALYRLKRHVVK